MKPMIAVSALLISTFGCRNAEFNGNSNEKRGANAVPARPSPSPYYSNPMVTPIMTPPVMTPLITLPPGATPTPIPTIPPVTAVECNSTNIKWSSETVRCPVNYAAFALDDSKPTFIACCPLPSADILTADAPTARSQCGSDEVAVGGSPGGNLLCQKLNIALYVMLPAQTTCYYGSGSAGGSGASKCTAPPATIQAMTVHFGSDACLPVPWGALVTKHGSNGNCSSSQANVLIYRATGQPVQMFK